MPEEDVYKRQQKLMPKEVVATVPPLYATEEEADPVARVKLFSCISGWTWYVTCLLYTSRCV